MPCTIDCVEYFHTGRPGQQQVKSRRSAREPSGVHRHLSSICRSNRRFIVTGEVRCRHRIRLFIAADDLKASGQDQDQEYDDNDSESSAGSISPTCTVAPSRQRADQCQNKNDDQDSSKHNGSLCWALSQSRSHYHTARPRNQALKSELI